MYAIRSYYADDPLERFDLVGISSFTAMIDDAYALADRYRAAGVPVVLGGLHVSLMPDEAAQHADSIVLYGAEGAWPRLVEARKGWEEKEAKRLTDAEARWQAAIGEQMARLKKRQEEAAEQRLEAAHRSWRTERNNFV